MVLATVLGLSAAVDQVLSPAPVDAAVQAPQAVFAAHTADLAAQAHRLASTTGPTVASLGTILDRQSAALMPPSPSPATTMPQVSPSSGPLTLAQLLEAVRTSATALLDQARREPDGGLARLYTAAAEGRLEALRPLLPSGGATGPDLLTSGTAPLPASCASGTPSPAATDPAGPTTAGATAATGAAGGGPASSAATPATVSPQAVAATQAVLRAQRHLTYLYQVAEVRLERGARTDADGFEAAVRKGGSEAAAWVRAACATPSIPEAGYELPATFLKEPAAGLGAVEDELRNAALDLVAASEGDLRTWAMAQYFAAGTRARHWSPSAGAGPALPGFPEDMTPVPSGSPSAGQH